MNVVDSCGWLEYFSGGANASFFEPILHDTGHLIVPALTLFEVCRRVLAMRGEESARVVYRAMTVPQVVNLSPADHFAAAQSARRWKLALADAIIWQTAQAHGAALYTQDVDLQGLPGVVYRPKLSPSP